MYSTRCRIVCLLIFLLGVGCAIFSIYTDNQTTNLYSESQVCRVMGCGGNSLYPEWGRRWCIEHIVGDKPCHAAGSCSNTVPRSSIEIYCDECRAYSASKMNSK